jgi:hypothetical protein
MTFQALDTSTDNHLESARVTRLPADAARRSAEKLNKRDRAHVAFASVDGGLQTWL